MTSANQTSDLKTRLHKIGLRFLSENLDDFLARTTKGGWSAVQILEQILKDEELLRQQRSLERRLRQSRIGRFKPMADFDWNWPKKIEREVIERALTLDFIPEARNLILLGSNGLGKTMITKNIAYQAVMAGYSVRFQTASEILDDLQCDSPLLLRKRLKKYAQPQLLCIDEVGYLSYDHHAADLLYEIINRRYENRSILVTTNRAFKEWNLVFPNAACISTMLDRLMHHADVTQIQGQSYRVRESEQEAQKRRKKR
jgi:DNA replication protein DnaC